MRQFYSLFFRFLQVYNAWADHIQLKTGYGSSTNLNDGLPTFISYAYCLCCNKDFSASYLFTTNSNNIL